MRLHVLTAVSRPENLPAIEASLDVAVARWPHVEMLWHWDYDLERQHVGGQAVKNAMLDKIDDPCSWVNVLDDDTLAHPDVLKVVDNARRASFNAIIVSQRRTDGRVLEAKSENLCPGSVDIGQAFLRRDFIGDHRIPEHYNGDGMFLAALLAGEPVTYLPDVVSLHNAITGVEIGV